MEINTTMYHRQYNTRTGGRTVSHKSDWTMLEPHTGAWYEQARMRYRDSDDITRSERMNDPYHCFSCLEKYRLSDYYIQEDKSKTFRYCRKCANLLIQGGIHLVLWQQIQDPQQTIALHAIDAIATRTGHQTSQAADTKGYSPLFYIGVSIVSMCVLWYLFYYVFLPGIENAYNNMIYEYPHISQADCVCTQGDSAIHPSHFIALNLDGHIEVIQQLQGDPGKTKVYDLVNLSPDHRNDVVTVSFSLDSHPTMYVQIGSDKYAVQNDGTKFAIPNK